MSLFKKDKIEKITKESAEKESGKVCWNCKQYDSFACLCQLNGIQIDHLETCDKIEL